MNNRQELHDIINEYKDHTFQESMAAMSETHKDIYEGYMQYKVFHCDENKLLISRSNIGDIIDRNDISKFGIFLWFNDKKSFLNFLFFSNILNLNASNINIGQILMHKGFFIMQMVFQYD